MTLSQKLEAAINHFENKQWAKISNGEDVRKINEKHFPKELEIYLRQPEKRPGISRLCLVH